MDKINTGNWSTGNWSTGYRSTGYRSTGNFSTGYRSTGYRSTGNRSTGDCSTGNFSTGNWSTGNWSTGYRSTGYRSTGNRSTGDCSTGNFSTGYRSTGYRSTGNWSISRHSTGHFSTIDYSGFGAFNKPCSLEDWVNAEKPYFLYFNLTYWVDESDMTDEDKRADPDFYTKGGQLRFHDYQEAFKKSWDAAPEEDREKLSKLPNFDAEIFLEISGIDVRESKKTVIELTQKQINRIKELGVI